MNKIVKEFKVGYKSFRVVCHNGFFDLWFKDGMSRKHIKILNQTDIQTVATTLVILTLESVDSIGLLSVMDSFKTSTEAILEALADGFAEELQS